MTKQQAVVNRDDFLNLQLELHEANKQLQQYKSIVKTVDADNLPEGEVLVLIDDEIMKCNLTRRGKRAIDHGGFFIHRESQVSHTT